MYCLDRRYTFCLPVIDHEDNDDSFFPQNRIQFANKNKTLNERSMSALCSLQKKCQTQPFYDGVVYSCILDEDGKKDVLQIFEGSMYIYNDQGDLSLDSNSEKTAYFELKKILTCEKTCRIYLNLQNGDVVLNTSEKNLPYNF